MKSLLIIIASLSLFNESVNQHERTDYMFSYVTATYVTQSKTYFYTYRHNPTQMDSNVFTDFKNGSSKLVYEIPSALNVDTSKSSEFYIQVDTTKYYFENDLGYLTDNFYSIPNFMQFNYTTTTNIYISIPSIDTTPITNYGYALNTSWLYTKESFKQVLLGTEFFDGYDIGYTDGYANGNADGYDLGYTEGFDNGYEQGSNTNEELSGFFVLLSQAWASIASILSIQLFPGFTLGLLLFLPIIFGIAYALLKFLLGGSS